MNDRKNIKREKKDDDKSTLSATAINEYHRESDDENDSNDVSTTSSGSTSGSVLLDVDGGSESIDSSSSTLISLRQHVLQMSIPASVITHEFQVAIDNLLGLLGISTTSSSRRGIQSPSHPNEQHQQQQPYHPAPIIITGADRSHHETKKKSQNEIGSQQQYDGHQNRQLQEQKNQQQHDDSNINFGSPVITQSSSIQDFSLYTIKRNFMSEDNENHVHNTIKTTNTDTAASSISILGNAIAWGNTAVSNVFSISNYITTFETTMMIFNQHEQQEVLQHQHTKSNEENDKVKVITSIKNNATKRNDAVGNSSHTHQEVPKSSFVRFLDNVSFTLESAASTVAMGGSFLIQKFHQQNQNSTFQLMIAIIILILVVVLLLRRRRKRRMMMIIPNVDIPLTPRHLSPFNRRRLKQLQFHHQHQQNRIRLRSDSFGSAAAVRTRSDSFGSVQHYFGTSTSKNNNNNNNNISSYNNNNNNQSTNTRGESVVRGARFESFDGDDSTLKRQQQNYSTDLYRDAALQEDYELYLGQQAGYSSTEPFDISSNSVNTNNNYYPDPGTYYRLHDSSSQHHRRLRYFGPTIHSIQYATYSPPPTWEIASRHLLMGGTSKWNLRRTVSIVFINKTTKTTTSTKTTSSLLYENSPMKQSPSCPSIVIQETGAKSSTSSVSASSSNNLSKNEKKQLESKRIEFMVQSVSVLSKVPAEGGVLELYRINQYAGNTSHTATGNGKTNNIMDKEWKMEHTFTSAQSAAQFQMDVLAIQLLWPTIYNMYQGLALIHKGSLAYTGPEPVLHHHNEQNNDSSVSTTSDTSTTVDVTTPMSPASARTAAATTTTTTTTVAAAGSKTGDGVKTLNSSIPDEVPAGGGTGDGSDITARADDSGVAWDDAMRCFGSSFPSMEKRLEALWWLVFVRGTSGEQQQGTQQQGTNDTDPPTTPRPRLGSTSSEQKKSVSSDGHSTAGSGSAALNNDDDLEQRYLGGASLLEASYLHHRIVLGPVDFFRLFVPILPEASVPYADSSPARVEQMLRLRKRVARAAVLVRAYTRAKIIANKGWIIQNISHLGGSSSINYIKQRLGYDDNLDNQIHDSSARNEYYEPRVSKDLYCVVRGGEFFKHTKSSHWRTLTGYRNSNQFNDDVPTSSLVSGGNAAFSSYQAFTLVGIHLFDWPSDDISLTLHYTKDPVLCITSLRRLIEDNPDSTFLIHAVFFVPRKVVIVKVFVRSLAEGVDPKFDKLLNRYFNSDAEFRKDRLEMLVQLKLDSISNIMAFSSRIILWFVTFLLKICLLGQTSVPQFANSMSYDRTTIPAIKDSILGESYHFGGSLQKANSNTPLNYVSSTLHMSSQRKNSYVGRVIIGYIAGGYFSETVVDVCYNLAGESADELPERVLGVSRVVRFSLKNKISLESLSSDNFRCGLVHEVSEVLQTQRSVTDGLPSLFLRIFITDPLVATTSAIVRQLQTSEPAPLIQPPSKSQRSPTATSPLNILGNAAKCYKRMRAATIRSGDPFEQAVNELIQILDGVRIPVRKDQIFNIESKKKNGQLLSSLDDTNQNDSTKLSQDSLFVQMSILRRVTRVDIQRYFIASNCSLKTAAVRIVESAAWRGTYFPIDTRTCRIELQNGQFFQQGHDLNKNPVFYFRTTLLGPWRKDPDALIAAVLHRLETSINNLETTNEHVRCTLIVVMGKPYERKKQEQNASFNDNVKELEEKMKTNDEGDSTSVQTGRTSTARTATTGGGGMSSADSIHGVGTVGSGGEETAVDSKDGYDDAIRKAIAAAVPMNNPRIPIDEQWYTHATKHVLERLVHIVMDHYPERLNKVLIVLGHGNKSFIRTPIGGVVALASFVKSPRTRDKVRFLTRYRDLQQYVSPSELITLVGGTQLMNPQHFEC